MRMHPKIRNIVPNIFPISPHPAQRNIIPIVIRGAKMKQIIIKIIHAKILNILYRMSWLFRP